MRGRFGFLGVLFLIVFALIVGGIGYGLGQSAGPVTVVQPVGGVSGVVYPVGIGHGFGFGIFGFLFFFLFIGLIFAAIRPRRWGGGAGWGGPGTGGPGWGKRGWGPGPDNVPPPIQSMLEDWHRRAHEPGPTDPPKNTSTI